MDSATGSASTIEHRHRRSGRQPGHIGTGMRENVGQDWAEATQTDGNIKLFHAPGRRYLPWVEMRRAGPGIAKWVDKSVGNYMQDANREGATWSTSMRASRLSWL